MHWGTFRRRDGIIFDTNISWAFWRVLMAGVSWPSIRRMQKVHGQPSSAFGAKALIVAGLIHFGIPKSSPELRQWRWWPCVCGTGFAWGLSLIIGRQQAKFEGDCWYDLKVMLDRWLDRDMTRTISCIRPYHCKNHFDIQNSCRILEYKKTEDYFRCQKKGVQYLLEAWQGVVSTSSHRLEPYIFSVQPTNVGSEYMPQEGHQKIGEISYIRLACQEFNRQAFDTSEDFRNFAYDGKDVDIMLTIWPSYTWLEPTFHARSFLS